MKLLRRLSLKKLRELRWIELCLSQGCRERLVRLSSANCEPVPGEPAAAALRVLLLPPDMSWQRLVEAVRPEVRFETVAKVKRLRGRGRNSLGKVTKRFEKEAMRNGSAPRLRPSLRRRAETLRSRNGLLEQVRSLH